MTILHVLERGHDDAASNETASAGSAPSDDADPYCPSPDGPGAEANEPVLEVVGGDLEVPLVDGRITRYTNLDYAASAPCLAAVAAHLTEILPHYASVHRGAGYASQVCTSLYESARQRVGRFVDARPDDVTVFTRNTTDALNLLANCVPAGGEVVYLDIEHHANLLPWQRYGARWVPAGTTIRGTLVALRAELTARPAALLAITGASNVTGEVLPLDDVVAIAHETGARVVVDAAQLAPHRRLSLTDSGVDYVAFSGHKLYAPFGAGALIGRRDWLDAAPPYLAGGGAVRTVDVDGVDWCEAPQRHEAGTPNVPGVAALALACDQLSDLPAEALESHEAALRESLERGLSALPGVRLHRIWRDSDDTIGVVAFTVDNHEPGQVAAYLSAEHGIGVRDGKFCAHPLLARLGTPDGAVRVSFGVGTTSTDVDQLVSAVTELLSTGPRWDYARADGRWAPTPDPRPLPSWATGAPANSGASPCTADR